jgi:hypothetical protein
MGSTWSSARARLKANVEPESSLESGAESRIVTAFLRDPAVWSVLIAIAALVLSQIPPVSQLLKGRRVRMMLARQFSVWHVMGRVHVDIVVGIRNVAGRDIFISRIDCFVVDDQGRGRSLAVPTYLQAASGSDASEFVLNGLLLAPGDYWSHILRCSEELTDREQDELEEIRRRFDAAGISDFAPQNEGATLPEADAALLDQAVGYFNRHFWLLSGHYRLLITATSQSGNGKDVVAGVAGCGFTLYDGNIVALRSIVDKYRYGFGVLRDIPDPIQPGFIAVGAKPLDELDLSKAYAATAAKISPAETKHDA